MSGTEAKQRLVDLDVGEVSIVDVPANEEVFVVTKAKGSTSQESGVTVPSIPAEVAANMTMQYLIDCMYMANGKFREGKMEEAKAELERITAMLDQVKQFTATVTKAATDIAAEVTKAKGDDKDKKVPAFMKESVKAAIETLKAAMGDDEEETEDAKTEKALAVILKAGKAQFSKERMTKLHEAFVHMASMYKDAAPEEFQKAMDAWTAKPASPQTDSGSATEGGGTTGTNLNAPKAAAPANGSAIKAADGTADGAPAWFTKSMEDVKKSIEEVKETTVAVSKRVEAVEKVDAVSKALPQNETDKVVQKSAGQGSIWKGVL